jgi:hypothetical protein
MPCEVMRGRSRDPADRAIYDDQGRRLDLSAYCRAEIFGFPVGNNIYGQLFVERLVSNAEYLSLPREIRDAETRAVLIYDERAQGFRSAREADLTEEPVRRAGYQALNAAARDGIIEQVGGQRQTGATPVYAFDGGHLRLQFDGRTPPLRRATAYEAPPLDRERLRRRFQPRPRFDEGRGTRSWYGR